MGLLMTVCTCTSSTTSLTVADFEALSRNDFGGLALYFSDKGFDWNTGHQNLIHVHRAGPRWDVDQDFFGELQKRGPACEAAQPDLCLCDSLYISRVIVVKFWMIARPAVAVLDIYIYMYC